MAEKADKTLKEDDEELVVVEEKPEDKAKAAAKVDETKADEEDEDDEDEPDDKGDARLAESQDDTDVEVVSANRKRRLKRREIQKRAREHSERELRLLREQNDAMARRLAAVEGHALTTNEQTIEQRLREALAEARQAEQIMAQAITAGNGEDVAAALRIRDEANGRAYQLTAAKQQVAQFKQQQAKPGPDPRVASLAKEWLTANPWYDPNGRDEDSRVTKAIDDGLVSEGFDPKSIDYWHELTRRVSARVGGGAPAAKDDADDAAQSVKRKAPPTGNSREYTPPSTRKEVYVTAERKQAMIDAGVWDDPAVRNRYLKAYQAYDKNSAR